MSLVLSIFDSRSAVVVSDGRSVHLNEAGNPEFSNAPYSLVKAATIR